MKPLLQESSDPFTLELLRSAEDDAVPEGALQRALLAVTAGSAIGLGAAVTATSATQGLSWTLVVKQLFLSVTVGLAVTAVGSAVVQTMTAPGPRPASLLTAAPAAPSTAARASDPAPEPVPTTLGAEPLVAPVDPADPRASVPSEGRVLNDDSPSLRAPTATDTEAGDAASARVPTSPSFSMTPTPTSDGAPVAKTAMPEASLLALEVARVDAARTALRGGEPARALAELERYDREIQRKSLGVEAAILRVDALVAAGRRAEAQVIARRLLAAGQGGQHAERLRVLILQDR